MDKDVKLSLQEATELFKAIGQNSEVTSRINSPMTWIAAAGALIVFIGGLMWMIYSNNLSAHSMQISDNAKSIKEIQGITVKMQSNQEAIIDQIGRLADNVDETGKVINHIQVTRFEQKDGQDILDRSEAKIAVVQKDVDSLDTKVNALKETVNDLKILEVKVDSNTIELKNRNTFMQQTDERLRDIERSIK